MKSFCISIILFFIVGFHVLRAQLPGGVTLDSSPCNVVADGDFGYKGAWINNGVTGTNIGLFNTNNDSLRQTIAGINPSGITVTFLIKHIDIDSSTAANMTLSWNGIPFVTFAGNNNAIGTVILFGGATCSTMGLVNNVSTRVTILIPNSISQGLLHFAIAGNDDYELDDVMITGVCDHLFWLRSDTGTSTTINNATISQWEDQGNLALHVGNALVANRPKYLEKGANFNPTINFSTAEDFLERINVQSNFGLEKKHLNSYSFLLSCSITFSTFTKALKTSVLLHQ